MYVCVCVCMHVVYECLYVICVHIGLVHVHMYVCVYVVCKFLYVILETHVCISLIYLHMYVHMYAHMYNIPRIIE
jgi:hypothetical protein